MNYTILNFEFKLACVNINELVSNCIDYIYRLCKIKKDPVLEETWHSKNKWHFNIYIYKNLLLYPRV